MPISKDEFRSIDEDGPSLPDLAPGTTQGAVYRFLLEHARRFASGRSSTLSTCPRGASAPR
jgi:hypothetical protein